MKNLSQETFKETTHSALSMPSAPKGSGAACHFPLPALVGAGSLARANGTEKGMELCHIQPRSQVALGAPFCT